MKINDYKVGYSFEIDCAKSFRKINGEPTGQIIYDSFGIMENHAYMWARKPEDIIKVKATIIEEDVIVGDLFKKDSGYDTNQVDYFGWINFEHNEPVNISMIYPNIKQYFVCFPDGPDTNRFWKFDSINVNYDTGEKTVEHLTGDRRGMTVRLKIEEIFTE